MLQLLTTLNNEPNNRGKHNSVEPLHGGCLKWILVERTLYKAFLNTNSINRGMNKQCVHRNKTQALRVGTGGKAANIVKYASSRGILEQEHSPERSCCQYPLQACSYCVSNM